MNKSCFKDWIWNPVNILYNYETKLNYKKQLLKGKKYDFCFRPRQRNQDWTSASTLGKHVKELLSDVAQRAVEDCDPLEKLPWLCLEVLLHYHAAQGSGLQAEHSSFAERRGQILEFKAAEAVEIAGLGIRQKGFVHRKDYEICTVVP